MRKTRRCAILAAVTMAAALAGGCRTAVRTVPPPVPAAPPLPASAEAPLARMGYTVQVGAFAVLDNARNLAAALSAAGLDAFYFPAGGGLFKVRFGNYPSREAALRDARKLEAEGRIGDYMIVGPPEGAAVRAFPPDPAVRPPAPPASALRDRLVATAESFIGVDYAWGGTSTRSGFDCSGLVLAVYQLNGLAMPRSVLDQFRAGTAVPGNRIRRGDLVFFTASQRGEPSHVGIYIGNGTFIHAPGSGKNVRRESLDSDYFRSRYAGARAYL